MRARPNRRQITPVSPDAQPTLAFEEMLLGAENTVDIQIDEPGAAHFMYQIVGRYYLPWDEIAADVTTPEAILLNVAYDRTELAVDETVEVAVTALLNPALTPLDMASPGRPTRSSSSWASRPALRSGARIWGKSFRALKPRRTMPPPRASSGSS